MWKLALAYMSIFVVWGSTYLAIRWSVDVLPPTLAMGPRNLIAGMILLVYARTAQEHACTSRDVFAAMVVGILLFTVSQGMLGSAQTRVPSSLAAIVFATMPLWIPAVLWMAGGGRPSLRVIAGILIGLVGTILLLYGRGYGGALAPLDGGLLLGAALCWSLGTVVAARLPRPPSPVMTAGLHLTFGGIVLTAIGFANGDIFAMRLGLDFTTLRALLSILYLLVFGTLIGFAAYMWLLDHQPVVRVSTYAFVNPVIAVAIGWLIEDEQIRPLVGIAMAVILVAVAVISTEGTRRKKRHRADTER